MSPPSDDPLARLAKTCDRPVGDPLTIPYKGHVAADGNFIPAEAVALVVAEREGFDPNSEECKRARGLFMDRMPVEKVASEVGVSPDTVLVWASKGAWNAKRRLAQESALDAERLDIQEERLRRRQKFIKQTADVAETLLTRVASAMSSTVDGEETPKVLTPSDLKNLADTVQKVTASAGQVLGISETGSRTEETEKAGAAVAAAAGRPLVAVFAGGGLPMFTRPASPAGSEIVITQEGG